MRELKDKIKKAPPTDPNLDSLKKTLTEMEKSTEEARKKAESLEKEEKVRTNEDVWPQKAVFVKLLFSP